MIIYFRNESRLKKRKYQELKSTRVLIQGSNLRASIHLMVTVRTWTTKKNNRTRSMHWTQYIVVK